MELSHRKGEGCRILQNVLLVIETKLQDQLNKISSRHQSAISPMVLRNFRYLYGNLKDRFHTRM